MSSEERQAYTSCFLRSQNQSFVMIRTGQGNLSANQQTKVDLIPPPWFQERSKPEICIIGKQSDDAYKVAIDPLYLPVLKSWQCQMDFDYNPTQPGETQQAILGIYNATKKACDRWLQHTAGVICSGLHPKAEQAYHHLAQLNACMKSLSEQFWFMTYK